MGGPSIVYCGTPTVIALRTPMYTKPRYWETELIQMQNTFLFWFKAKTKPTVDTCHCRRYHRSWLTNVLSFPTFPVHCIRWVWYERTIYVTFAVHYLSFAFSLSRSTIEKNTRITVDTLFITVIAIYHRKYTTVTSIINTTVIYTNKKFFPPIWAEKLS